MSLDGRQTNNDGFTEAQSYANDPDNETAPSPMHHEKEVGVNAYTLATLADALVTIVNTPTADQKAALDAANAPAAGNAFTTVADLANFSAPTSLFYDFRTDTGVPASGEIKMDDADPDSATTLSFHNLNRDGNNVGNLLLLLGAGDAIVVQNALDGDKTYNFDITGSATQTGGAGASGYITFPISLFAEGATAIADTDAVVAALFQDGAGVISNATIDSTNSIDGGALDIGTVARAALEADAIDGTKLADSAVDTEHITADAIDGTKVADNAIDSEHITADAIDGTKVADNAIDSEHYTDGSIDNVHLANDVIDGTKLADNAVDSEHYTDGSIDRVHLEADIIDSTKLADNSINSEHYVDGSVDNVHLATGIDGAKLTAGSVPASALASTLPASYTVLTGSGTHTPTVTGNYRVICVGAGGGGGNGRNATGDTQDTGAAGGNSGYVIHGLLSLVASTGYSFSCGAGGLGGTTNGVDGADGGDTTFTGPSTITGEGGEGGPGGSSVGALVPAPPATQDKTGFNLQGGEGGAGTPEDTAQNNIGGDGGDDTIMHGTGGAGGTGSSTGGSGGGGAACGINFFIETLDDPTYLGDGGKGGDAAGGTTTGDDATGYGAAGGGGAAAATGGDGTDGIILIKQIS